MMILSAEENHRFKRRDRRFAGASDFTDANIAVIERAKPRKTIINYLYDLGDCSEHRLTVANIRSDVLGIRYPRYVAGEHNALPEDCGGVLGFYAMQAAAAEDRPPSPILTAIFD